MKRFGPIGYIVLVLALFLAGDRVLAFALGEVVSHSQFRFSRVYRGGLDYDVLVVGDSRGVHSIFAPKLSQLLCRPVFNMAFNGMSTDIEEALVRDYLARNAPPKLVLIEVSNVTRGDGLLNEMRLYARADDHMAALIERRDPSTPIWMRVSHLYAFDDELALRAFYHLRHSDQDWVMPADAEMTPAVIAKLRAAWYPPPQARPANVAALQRLIGLLRQHDVTVVPYIAPYHPVYAKFAPHLSDFVQQLQQDIGASPRIVDLSRELSDNDDFADVVHVNRRGSMLVTDHMASRLDALLPRQVAGVCPTEAKAAPAGTAAARPIRVSASE